MKLLLIYSLFFYGCTHSQIDRALDLLESSNNMKKRSTNPSPGSEYNYYSRSNDYQPYNQSPTTNIDYDLWKSYQDLYNNYSDPTDPYYYLNNPQPYL